MSQSAIFAIPEAPAPAPVGDGPQAKKPPKQIRLGVLDNSKGNADHLLAMIVDLVKAKVPIASVLNLRKPTAGLPAPAEILDQLTREVDCVVTAMAD